MKKNDATRDSKEYDSSGIQEHDIYIDTKTSKIKSFLYKK